MAALTAWVKSGAAAAPAAAAARTVSASTAPAEGAVAASSPSDPGAASGSGSAPTSGSGSDSPAAPLPGPASESDAASAAVTDSASASAASSGPPDPELLESLPAQVMLFADAVKPLFREKCGKCHIKESPAGGLGVDQHRALLEGGFSGAGIVAHDRQKSFVMTRLVLPPSDDEHMPPEGEPQLDADEVELIGAWIDQGAPADVATETAKLTAGAVRALSARGVKAPPALAAQSGGCAACSVPGAPRSQPPWLEAQLIALFGSVALFTARRRRRA
jgi:hypothetical protein